MNDMCSKTGAPTVQWCRNNRERDEADADSLQQTFDYKLPFPLIFRWFTISYDVCVCVVFLHNNIPYFLHVCARYLQPSLVTMDYRNLLQLLVASLIHHQLWLIGTVLTIVTEDGDVGTILCVCTCTPAFLYICCSTHTQYGTRQATD